MRLHVSSYVVGAAILTGATVSGCSSPWDYVGPWDGGAIDPSADDSGIEPSGSSSSGGGSSGSDILSNQGGNGFGGSSSSSSSGGSSSGIAGFGSSSSSSSGGSSSGPKGLGSSSSSSSGGTSSGMRGGSSSSGGSSSGSGSGATMSCPPIAGAAPTWSSIWTKDGFSTTCHGCHGSASSASAAYTWLKGQQGGVIINGAKSTIAVDGSSPLMIFGGSMPPNGSGISAAAQCALIEWVAAGALNN